VISLVKALLLRRATPYQKENDNYGSCNALIRGYDEAGNVIEPHEHAGEFKEP